MCMWHGGLPSSSSGLRCLHNRRSGAVDEMQSGAGLPRPVPPDRKEHANRGADRSQSDGPRDQPSDGEDKHCDDDADT